MPSFKMQCVIDIPAGSTTAEGACESVRLACEQLLQNTLQPQVKALQDSKEGFKGDSAEAVWKGLIQAVSSPMNFPNKQLTAYALFDGSRRDKAPGKPTIQTSRGSWVASTSGTAWGNRLVMSVAPNRTCKSVVVC